MPQLLAIAEYITKTLAICVVCGEPANHTQRLVASSDRVLVGATGLYEARCRHCFDPMLAAVEQNLSGQSRGQRVDGVSRPARRRFSRRHHESVDGVRAVHAAAQDGAPHLAGAEAAESRHDARDRRRRSGCSVVFKVLVSHQQAFGETMMFVYYALALPLSWRIHRGFYDDGVWADSTFIPYNEVGGISWREGEHDVTLVRDLTIAQYCTSSHSAGGQVRRRAPAAARQNRRTRDSFARHRTGPRRT